MTSAIRHLHHTAHLGNGPVAVLRDVRGGRRPCVAVERYRRANANATNPFLQARHGTVVQLAVFEAVARKYSQLDAIAGDVDDARVLGGIHWRYDQVGGNALGRAVAAEVVKNRLRAVHP